VYLTLNILGAIGATFGGPKVIVNFLIACGASQSIDDHVQNKMHAQVAFSVGLYSLFIHSMFLFANYLYNKPNGNAAKVSHINAFFKSFLTPSSIFEDYYPYSKETQPLLS